jgi:hypothetical protein
MSLILVAFAVISLIGLAVAVVGTVRSGGGAPASFTYRAYGA